VTHGAGVDDVQDLIVLLQLLLGQQVVEIHLREKEEGP
jgi:hypothetical protein